MNWIWKRGEWRFVQEEVTIVEPLFFGVITKPWQVYVMAFVIALGSGVGIWRGVVRANRADERKGRCGAKEKKV